MPRATPPCSPRASSARERRPERRERAAPVIERYTRPEIGAVWSEERKLATWLEVELAVVDALAERGDVPRADAEAIRAQASFTAEAVRERERVTDHDMAAFVDVVAASIGEAGRWVHHGLTSSDVLDTALALQLREAGEICLAGARAYRDALVARAREHVDTLCVGRTHGVHAEATTFGIKVAGLAFEAQRNVERFERAFAGVAVGALSGAVGTYSANGPEIEAAVLERLGLAREDVSTQVVARDRHAELLGAIALAGAGLERFATEVRHLQRTEVREVEEPFRAGQKGSSAMPHKRNPITCERIGGLARLLRGYAQAGGEDVALWHERDISHSSVERVALPDATILLDYMQALATGVVSGMTVRADRMRANLGATHGALFSQRALLALVESGRSRDDAYRIVQENAQRAWDSGTPFRDLLAAAAPDVDLETVFDPAAFVRHAEEIVGRLEAIS
jgi:adenylosuccinate lyase